MAKGWKKARRIDEPEPETQSIVGAPDLEPPITGEEEESLGTEIDEHEPKPPDPDEPEPEEPKFWVIAKGRALTSKAGIIDNAESKRRGGIDASYFIGGQATMDEWIRKGVIVEG